jgi:hypothetical protein
MNQEPANIYGPTLHSLLKLPVVRANQKEFFFSIKSAFITYKKYYTRPLHIKMHTAAHSRKNKEVSAQGKQKPAQKSATWKDSYDS